MVSAWSHSTTRQDAVMVVSLVFSVMSLIRMEKGVVISQWDWSIVFSDIKSIPLVGTPNKNKGARIVVESSWDSSQYTFLLVRCASKPGVVRFHWENVVDDGIPIRRMPVMRLLNDDRVYLKYTGRDDSFLIWMTGVWAVAGSRG